jgi:hypothetical protein
MRHDRPPALRSPGRAVSRRREDVTGRPGLWQRIGGKALRVTLRREAADPAGFRVGLVPCRSDGGHDECLVVVVVVVVLLAISFVAR